MNLAPRKCRACAGVGHGGAGRCETCRGLGKLCPASLAYRGMADIGQARRCGNPATGPGGIFCKRHDPVTRPVRDAQGRITRRV